MAHQKILSLITYQPDVRATVFNASCNDSQKLFDAWARQANQFPETTISSIPLDKCLPENIEGYPSVLHALADGWQLMGPPVVLNDAYALPHTWCQWWLTK